MGLLLAEDDLDLLGLDLAPKKRYNILNGLFGKLMITTNLPPCKDLLLDDLSDLDPEALFEELFLLSFPDERDS